MRRLTACSLILVAAGLTAKAADEPPHSAALDRMIVAQAKRNGVPEKLVRRIVMRESKYDPRARNHLYWGLMQISYPTAKSMGFKGTPDQLLNPLVNLTYAVPYLANAFIIAGKKEDEAVRLYAAGYYFTARKRGLLNELRTAESAPFAGAIADAEEVVASVVPPPPPPVQYGIFGALFGSSSAPAPAPEQVADATPAPAPNPASTQSPVSTQSAAAAPSAVEPPQSVSTAPAHVADTMATTDHIMLVADKNGDMQPPRKWLHDGGMTEMARGEQPIDKVAAYVAADEKPARKVASRSHKILVFASIDMPQAAQAYASADGQDQRLAQASSQAAIADATSAPPVSQDAPHSTAQAAVTPTELAVETPAKAAPRKVAHKAHPATADTTTKIAKAKTKTDGKIKPTDLASAASSKHPVHHAKAKDDAPVLSAQRSDDDGALRH